MNTNYNLRKRILITGGAGFLGSHLCERLLSEGNDIICLDNFFTGTKCNIAHLLDHSHFELMRKEVTFSVNDKQDDNHMRVSSISSRFNLRLIAVLGGGIIRQ